MIPFSSTQDYEDDDVEESMDEDDFFDSSDDSPTIGDRLEEIGEGLEQVAGGMFGDLDFLGSDQRFRSANPNHDGGASYDGGSSSYDDGSSDDGGSEDGSHGHGVTRSYNFRMEPSSQGFQGLQGFSPHLHSGFQGGNYGGYDGGQESQAPPMNFPRAPAYGSNSEEEEEEGEESLRDRIRGVFNRDDQEYDGSHPIGSSSQLFNAQQVMKEQKMMNSHSKDLYSNRPLYKDHDQSMINDGQSHYHDLQSSGESEVSASESSREQVEAPQPPSDSHDNINESSSGEKGNLLQHLTSRLRSDKSGDIKRRR